MNIVLENYTKIIKRSVVLDNINYTFISGNIYGLYGKNASGKSMLMRAIAGLILPTSGRALIDGRELRKDIDFPESIGVMIETPFFLPQYTGFINLKLLASIKKRVSDDDIRNLMLKVGLSDDKKVRRYSLGMRQRLGIAAAIMESPDILLLDEPFNGIDEDSYGDIKSIIQDFNTDGKIIIISCHDREMLDCLCNDIIHLKNGKVI